MTADAGGPVGPLRPDVSVRDVARHSRRCARPSIEQSTPPPADSVPRCPVLPEQRAGSTIAGNGTWFVTDRGGRAVPNDSLPWALRDALYAEAERGQYLGFYVEDIRRGGRR